MAWTTPITAVANAAFTAAQFNASVRDNLLVTPAAIATTAGSHFATTGANAIAERIPANAAVATVETTTSTVYTNLATVGPAVTVTTGTSVLLGFHCRQSNATLASNCWTTYAVSGATTIAAADGTALSYDSPVANSTAYHGTTFRVTGLTAGSNTFTLQYRVSAGTGTFHNRNLWVLPF
jgi:hypothetical protein